MATAEEFLASFRDVQECVKLIDAANGMAAEVTEIRNDITAKLADVNGNAEVPAGVHANLVTLAQQAQQAIIDAANG